MRVRKKYVYSVLEAYRNYKNWMFFDNDLTQIEILPPKLETLEMMKKYDLSFVVKGFKNIVEYSKWERIRLKFGMATALLLTRCFSEKFLVNTLTSFANNEPLPDSYEIKKEVENNSLLTITSDTDEKRILERDRYAREYRKYSLIFHREVVKLIKQKRLERLELIN